MDRNLSRRIRNVEKLLSKAEEFVSLELKKREEYLSQLVEHLRLRPNARAIFFAAVVALVTPVCARSISTATQTAAA